MIAQIQTGSFTATSASGTTVNRTLSPAVNLSRSVVMFTTRYNDTAGRDVRHQWRASLTTTTNLQFVRHASSWAVDQIIEWTVIEFEEGWGGSIQAGSIDCVPDSGTTVDVTITEIDRDAAFPILSVTTSRTVSVTGPRMSMQSFPDATTLRFTHHTAPTTDEHVAQYQVVEFDGADAAVQRGVITVGSANATGNATLTAVDLAKTFIAHGGLNYEVDVVSKPKAQLQFTSTTNLRATRRTHGGTTQDMPVQYYAVELTDGHVESGEVVIPDTATVPDADPSFDAMTADKTFVVNADWRGNLYNTDGDSNHAGIRPTQVLGAGRDEILVERAGTSRDLRIAWFVVEMETAATPLSLTGDTIQLESPFSNGDPVDTAAATGGTPPYTYQIISQVKA